MTPAVSVIVPARDASPTLDRALVALRSQTFERDYEVIVVDDGSRDDTVAIARRHQSFVTVISNAESQGPGAARNRGVEAARARVLAFTDADCFPTPTWLAAGVQEIERADLVQGRVEPDPAVPRTPFDRSLLVERDGGFYQTANLFVRRETFDAVGGFHDWLLEERAHRSWAPDRRRGRASRTPIGEDTLFAWKARRLGARSAYAPKALVHHVVEAGGLLDAMADRWHWARDMPGLVRLVPELRAATLHRHLFFNIVTARFDYALAGVAVAAATRRICWLLAARPYARHLLDESRQWPTRQRRRYLLGAPVVEAATLAGLLSGTVAWRSPVL